MESSLAVSSNQPHVTGHVPRPHASKACNECKQQKLRCSAKLDYPNPCPRCKRLGLVCTIENGFRRVNKRQKSAILQRENQLLREQLSTVYASNDPRISTSPSDANFSHSPQNSDSSAFPIEGSRVPITATATRNDTVLRSLGCIIVDAKEIDEIFALYFLHYSKHLPFLDSQITPNLYYEQSPLLFWAIISAGTRRYTGNPTLYGSLAEPVLELVWSSMTSGTVIPNIQGLLILTTWPFPTNSTSKDNTFTLSGMSVNLALQIGLHVPLQGQEYSRTRIDLSNDGIARRVQLWSYCVVVHQKAACSLGYPITVPLELFQRKLDLNGVMDFAPRSLKLELRLASIIGRINSVFSDFNFDDLQSQPQAAPAMMLNVFEAQLNEPDKDGTAIADLEILYLEIARLQLRIYYLRCPENTNFSLNLTKIYTTALQVVELIGKLDGEMDLASFCPHYVYRMLALATSVLLRVLKSSLAGYVTDELAGKTTYFLAISLLKKMSVQTNDMPGRMAGILSQLWTSEKVFKMDGGGEGSATLRIQSRLSMSMLHDTMWRWREEYGGQANENSKLSRTKDQNLDSSDPRTVASSIVEYPQKATEPGNTAINNTGFIPNLDLTAMDVPVSSQDLLALDDASFLWDPIDHGFESMIELFPDSWPL